MPATVKKNNPTPAKTCTSRNQTKPSGWNQNVMGWVFAPISVWMKLSCTNHLTSWESKSKAVVRCISQDFPAPTHVSCITAGTLSRSSPFTGRREWKYPQKSGESASKSLLHKVLPDSTNVAGRTAGMFLTSPFLASSSSSYKPSVVGAGCTLRPHCFLAFERATSLWTLIDNAQETSSL